LKTTITYKEIILLSLPIIAGSAIDNFIILMNTAFLGHVSQVSLGAAAIGGIYYLALVMVGFGFGIGTQIIIARRLGENKRSEIGSTLHHSTAFLAPIALLFLVLTLYFGKSFFHYFIHSKDIYNSVMVYMHFRIFGIFFAFFNILFRSFYTGILKTKVIGYSSAIIAVFNVFFDYTLIFGHFGFPALGIAGAGISSVIAEVSGSTFFLVYTFMHKGIDEFNITSFAKLKFKILWNILKVASPVMLQFAVSFGGWFAFFIMVEGMGETPLAISNIIRTVYMIVLLPLWGYSSTTNTLTSYKIGTGNIGEVGPLIRKIIKLSFVTVISFVIIINLFAHSWFRLFTNDIILINGCIPVLQVVSISSIFISFAFILYNGVAGTGNTKISLFIETFIITLYVFWTYFTTHEIHPSIAKVWTSEILYGIAMAFLSGLYLKFGNWKKASI
jgi:putative MATE family efflux protein